jgi:hypothetical protein
MFFFLKQHTEILSEMHKGRDSLGEIRINWQIILRKNRQVIGYEDVN